MPKESPKPKVKAPGSPIDGAPKIYKQPSMPPIPNARGKQPAMTPEGIVYNVHKPKKMGDLVKPANPKAVSAPLGKVAMNEIYKDFYPSEIPLQDGSIYKPPKKKREY